ncbi:MAG: polysaccharide deacetylase family protein [Candidatus Omnitrophota bacterium]|nr:polysaccharide deacetylase family protein [Candidatus Omnitrophota bacterium]
MLKEFGPDNFKVREKVADRPSMGRYASSCAWGSDIFHLRIDADEYTEASFRTYYPVFEKHAKALTVFFNACSFRNSEKEVLKCRDLGIDIQSHAFYHYTYNDYASNRHNIHLAKEFFDSLGVETIGFAAPTGKWNASLMKALEDEGYKYSSDFSYDYMAFPSYPLLCRRPSRVMEIPIFPVAPELFFQGTPCEEEIVLEYYKNAIDGLIAGGLPVIIYAHTSPAIREVPSLLEEIADYAVGKKGLRPVSMTGLFHMTDGKAPVRENVSLPGETGKMPMENFSGRRVRPGIFSAVKDALKEAIDFERITPEEELKCGHVKKALKLLARKMT